MTPTSIDIIKLSWDHISGSRGVPPDSCISSDDSRLVCEFPLPMLHALLADVFALVFRSSESVHKPFMSKFSIHCSYVILGGIFLLIYKFSCFMGLVSAVKDLGVMVLDVELKSLISQGIFVPLWLLSIVDCCSYGVYFPRPAHIFTSSVLMLSFYLFLWRLCSSNFQVPFWENCSIFSYRFVMSVGGSKFRVFLHNHQETSECWTSLESLEQILLYNSFYILFILLIFY